ncbi:DNA/RNA non-specific endonuclease [Sinosporangium siamense]|uniref:Serine protease n=1 Tax=Sinosporangium siamense TaxID=1367973 RepID=A0A919RPS5_9ACTN|nr:DNA/RNA non-specific endonuclease [Sinosporangium siamense]GII96785.1 endonuclease [Sinosporangium siamense]
MTSIEETPTALLEDVAARVAGRSEQRHRRIAVLAEPGGIARADEPERVASRIDRLSRHYPGVRPIDPAAITAAEPAAVTAAADLLERIINTNDLLPVGYLEGGALAARAVARVVVRDARGRPAGYGTGSLISPDLLLTNHHVLSDAATAGWSGVEFDYQDGVDGHPLPLRRFSLDPGRFFLADEELDFALVAVKAGAGELARFGFNRVMAAEGKAIVGDFVTIIQHPGGERKQVALRENRIVDILDLFLHYQTDTEPGSSGSPVFNDQWEIVALHHAGVPAPDQGGVINEGVRISRLLDFLRGQAFPPAQQALLDRLFTERIGLQSPTPPAEQGETVTLTVAAPFDIRLHGEPVEPRGTAGAKAEAIQIDPDYSHGHGYDPDFLPGSHRVPLPELDPGLVPLAAVNRDAGDGHAHVLDYHHFSVVMNRQRRLAFFTAVNIDGESSVRIRRDPDRWIFDPRLPDDEQTGEEVYRDNPLDRGHLVRRLDPAWGARHTAAKAGNDDTFHFTNCTPQHKDFNQNRTTWAGLEDYILENADTRDLKVTVFTGPVLADDDDPYRGVQLPRQFWKVVAMTKQNGDLSATGYLLSQDHLIEGLEVAPGEFSYGAYKTYQVPVQRIEDLTHLSFDSLSDADPLAHMETTTTAREINDPRQLTL